MPDSLDTLLDRLAELERKVNQEGVERARIEFSDEYVELNKAEENIRNQKVSLLAGLEDSTKQYQTLKGNVMLIMESEGLEKAGQYQGKYQEKKAVNVDKVLSVLHGDLDHFLKLARITQKDLNAIATAEGGDREKELMDCIEVTSREMVDLIPLEVR